MELEKVMRKAGFKKTKSNLGAMTYNKRMSNQILMVTDATGKNAPESLEDPVLVYAQKLDGRRMGEPVGWISLEMFIITLGGFNGRGTQN